MTATLKRKRQGERGAPPQKKPLTKTTVDDTVSDADARGSVNDTDDNDEHSEEKTAHAPHTSALPSASELRAIHEASALYKGNTFKAQLDLLLTAVRPKPAHIPPLERALQALHAHFTALPSVAPVHPLEAAGALSAFQAEVNKKTKGGSPKKSAGVPAVAIPYPAPAPAPSTAWMVAFEAPTAMNVVGSWADSLAVKKPDDALFGVDVVVEMPATLFQEKDHRNSRFFHKRAFYLACLAASLSAPSSPLNVDVAYHVPDADPRRTALVLSPRKDGSPTDFTPLHATLCVLPVLSADSPIPAPRLAPAQANIRTAPPHQTPAPHQSDSTSVPTQVDSTQPQQSDPPHHAPTPLHNSTLALSHTHTAHTRLRCAHSALGLVPAFRDALGLVRVWAGVRGYVVGAGGFTEGGEGKGKGKKSANANAPYNIAGLEGLGAWWACVIEVLVCGEEPEDQGGEKKKKNKSNSRRPLLGKGLSSYQLFRGVMEFLATHDFTAEPVFMRVAPGECRFPRSTWTEHHAAVFVDATGAVNMLAGVERGALELLRYDAQNTLRILNTTTDTAGAEDADYDPFRAVFMTDVRAPHARFDVVVRIDLTQIHPSTPPSPDFPSPHAAHLHSLATTVRRALSTRARAVVLLSPPSLPYSLSSPHPVPTPSNTIATLGIILDPAHAPRLVDLCPPTEDPSAFRAFWGPKAELRRFKDGRIVESCVWDAGVVRAEDREGVPASVVRYVLAYHFGLREGAVSVLGADYGGVVKEAGGAALRGRGEGGYRGARAGYERLVRELKALEDAGDVPLMLVAAKPCAAALRYTSVFPPSPVLAAASVSASTTSVNPAPPFPASYLPAFDVTLQLERSSAWPDDLRAIARVKLALYEGMARGLEKRGCRACVVLDEDGEEGQEGGGALEVVLDGWAFHVRIGHDREVKLLEDVIAGAKRPQQRPPQQQHLQPQNQNQHHLSPPTATRLLQTYHRRYTHAPAHHAAILALHHALPAFAYTARLVQRWLGAHWLSARVSVEAIELLCAAVFLRGAGVGGAGLIAEGEEGEGRTGGGSGPGTDIPASGKRGFVRVVAFLAGWSGAGYVPLYEAVQDGVGAGAGKVEANMGKVEAGHGGWRLATLADSGGAVWCAGVSVPVALRVRQIAKATLACLAVGGATFKPLFEHPRADYDILIELDPRAVSRAWESIHPDTALWSPASNTNMTSEPVRVAFNPAELFFRDLQAVYGDTLELFYDVYGGTTIGGVWNPAVAGEGEGKQHAWRVFLGFSSLPAAPENETVSSQKKKERPSVVLNKEGVLAEIRRMGAGLVTRVTVQH